MPKRKTKKALADEAYHRIEAERVQIGMFDGGPKENAPVVELERWEDVPPACSGCGRKTLRLSTWTHLTWRGSPLADPEAIDWKLMCGNCGRTIIVPPKTWQAVREDCRQAFIDRAPNTESHQRRKGRDRNLD